MTMNDLTTQMLIISHALLRDDTSWHGRLFLIDKNNVEVKFMHAVVHGNAPDYIYNLITMTGHEGVIYHFRNRGNIKQYRIPIKQI